MVDERGAVRPIELPDALGIAGNVRCGELFSHRRELPDLLAIQMLDVLHERRPVLEPVLAGEHELGIGERDLAADAGHDRRDSLLCGAVAGARGFQQILGLLPELFKRRPGRKTGIDVRHDDLLSSRPCPHTGPKEDHNAWYRTTAGGLGPFRGREASCTPRGVYTCRVGLAKRAPAAWRRRSSFGDKI